MTARQRYARRFAGLAQIGMLAGMLAGMSAGSAQAGEAAGVSGGVGHADDAKRYRACISQTYSEPQKALETAQAWVKAGGGAPARHCVALALLENHQYQRAAERLEALADELPGSSTPSPVDILSQAANVWLLDGRPERARAVLDTALQRQPDSASLLIDRSRALAELHNYKAALNDLDRAVVLDPNDSDASAFRAAALRHLNRLDEALQSANRALELNPDNPSAKLERGAILHKLGDADGARDDWTSVSRDHPGTPAAEAAQNYLRNYGLKSQ